MISHDPRGALTTLVATARGMTDAEAERFLATGVYPDLSQPPADDAELSEADGTGLAPDEVRALLAGEVITAAGGLAAPPHTTFKFNPGQDRWPPGTPGGLGGQWKDDGLPGVDAPSASAPTGKLVKPAIIYKKHVDGAVVARRGGRRLRWNAGAKKYSAEELEDGAWVEKQQLTKTAAYSELKDGDWREASGVTDAPTTAPPAAPPVASEEPEVDTTSESPKLSEKLQPDPQTRSDHLRGKLFSALVDPEFMTENDFGGQGEIRFAEMLAFTDSKTGLHTRVTGVDFMGDGFQGRGMITDASGVDVGRFEVSVGQDAEGVYFARIDDVAIGNDDAGTSAKGRGFGSRWYTDLESELRIENVSYVELEDHSRGFWDRFGFVPEREGTEIMKRKNLQDVEASSETLELGRPVVEPAEKIGETVVPPPDPVARFDSPTSAHIDLTPEQREIDSRIRAAFRALEGRTDLPESTKEIVPGKSPQRLMRSSGYVSFADLREELADIPREQLDEVLIKLSSGNGDKSVFITPENAQFGLLQRDRDAALIKGNQPKHWLKIMPDGLPPATQVDPESAPAVAESEVPEIEAPTVETPSVSDATRTYTGPRFELPGGAAVAAAADEYRRRRKIDVEFESALDERARQLQKDDPSTYGGFGGYMKAKDFVRNMVAWETGYDETASETALTALYDVLPQKEYALRDNVVRRVSMEAALDARISEFARKNNLEDTPELREDLARRTREAFADKKIAIRVTPKNLEHILGDGRFKSQFETGKSKGLNNTSARAAAEHMWFGVDPAVNRNVEQRPIYGYVAEDGIRPAGFTDGSLGGLSTDALSQYGTIQVVFKDDVRDRTTAMYGDSLNHAAWGMPSPVNDPAWYSFSPTTTATPLSATYTELDRDPEDFRARSQTYSEAQIHGGVSTDDIAEVVFPSKPTAQLQKALADRGIPWRVLTLKSAAQEGDPVAVKYAEQQRDYALAEIKRLEERLADPRFMGDSDYRSDIKKMQKVLKTAEDALAVKSREEES